MKINWDIKNPPPMKRLNRFLKFMAGNSPVPNHMSNHYHPDHFK